MPMAQQICWHNHHDDLCSCVLRAWRGHRCHSLTETPPAGCHGLTGKHAQARVTNVTTIPIPPEAAAQGSSSTAVYDYTDATSTHLLVTLATWPVLFNQLVLDSLISNPSRNCAGFQVRARSLCLQLRLPVPAPPGVQLRLYALASGLSPPVLGAPHQSS